MKLRNALTGLQIVLSVTSAAAFAGQVSPYHRETPPSPQAVQAEKHWRDQVREETQALFQTLRPQMDELSQLSEEQRQDRLLKMPEAQLSTLVTSLLKAPWTATGPRSRSKGDQYSQIAEVLWKSMFEVAKRRQDFIAGRILAIVSSLSDDHSPLDYELLRNSCSGLETSYRLIAVPALFSNLDRVDNATLVDVSQNLLSHTDNYGTKRTIAYCGVNVAETFAQIAREILSRKGIELLPLAIKLIDKKKFERHAILNDEKLKNDLEIWIPQMLDQIPASELIDGFLLSPDFSSLEIEAQTLAAISRRKIAGATIKAFVQNQQRYQKRHSYNSSIFEFKAQLVEPLQSADIEKILSLLNNCKSKGCEDLQSLIFTRAVQLDEPHLDELVRQNWTTWINEKSQDAKTDQSTLGIFGRGLAKDAAVKLLSRLPLDKALDIGHQLHSLASAPASKFVFEVLSDWVEGMDARAKVRPQDKAQIQPLIIQSLMHSLATKIWKKQDERKGGYMDYSSRPHFFALFRIVNFVDTEKLIRNTREQLPQAVLTWVLTADSLTSQQRLSLLRAVHPRSTRLTEHAHGTTSDQFLKFGLELVRAGDYSTLDVIGNLLPYSTNEYFVKPLIEELVKIESEVALDALQEFVIGSMMEGNYKFSDQIGMSIARILSSSRNHTATGMISQLLDRATGMRDEMGMESLLAAVIAHLSKNPSLSGNDFLMRHLRERFNSLEGPGSEKWAQQALQIARPCLQLSNGKVKHHGLTKLCTENLLPRLDSAVRDPDQLADMGNLAPEMLKLWRGLRRGLTKVGAQK